MAFRYSPKIVTDGLVLYLDAANTKSYVSGSTTWNDLSKTPNNGSLINGPTFSGSNSGSIVFDGTNDYVSIPNKSDLISGKSELSIEMWFRLTSNVRPNIFNVGPSPISFENGSTNATTINAITNNQLSIACPFTLNEIICLQYTFNNGQVSVYKNGTLVSSQTAASSTLAIIPTTNITIGTWTWVYSNFITGNVYCVRLYNRSLTSSEVLQNYNALKGRYL